MKRKRRTRRGVDSESRKAKCHDKSTAFGVKDPCGTCIPRLTSTPQDPRQTISEKVLYTLVHLCETAYQCKRFLTVTTGNIIRTFMFDSQRRELPWWTPQSTAIIEELFAEQPGGQSPDDFPQKLLLILVGMVG